VAEKKNSTPGWTVWRFDQIATNVNARIDNPSKSGMEHYVGLEHLDADSLKIRRWGTPDDVEATKLMFKKGDIIFGRRRAYQRKLGVAEFDGICSAHAMVLRAKPEVVLPEFLPFFMQSDLFMNRAIEISVGSLSPTINWKTMAAQEFALPPIDEQQRLTVLLNTANTAREGYDELLAASSNLFMSSLEAAQGEGNFPLKSIGDLCDLIMDFRGRTPKKLGMDWGNGNIPALSANNVLHRRIDLQKETNYGSNVLYEKWMTRGELAEGDVLFTTEAPLGNVVRLQERRRYILSQRVIALRVKADQIRPDYFEAILCSNYFRRELERLATGTTAKGIRVGSLVTIKLPAPPLEYQAEWASRISEISQVERKVEERRIEMRELLSKLLNDSLSEAA
jgi:type I restriction enzyme S subunit